MQLGKAQHCKSQLSLQSYSKQKYGTATWFLLIRGKHFESQQEKGGGTTRVIVEHREAETKAYGPMVLSLATV